MVDPGDLIGLARQELTVAAASVDHPWRTPVFITGGAVVDGRVVVLRRFIADPPALDFFTDIRSPKVRAIREHPQVSWVFYHPQMRLQVRIRATAVVWHEEAAALADWEELSPSNRREYASAASPGSLWEDAPGLRDAEARRHFAVIRTVPVTWDFLQLSRDGHRRVQWTAQGGEVRLVP